MERAINRDGSATRELAESAHRSSDGAVGSQSPRLFILCGRDRKAEELRELFARCGTIRYLQIATDRSHKSRGFAFLQYEDALCASEAIKQFDQLMLPDGHTLKVTIAREKNSASDSSSSSSLPQKPQPGKLKRNQHSQDESSHTEGSEGGASDGAFPGKRQRSSPPMATLKALPLLHSGWKRQPSSVERKQSLIYVASLQMATLERSADEEIADILSGIITQIERLTTESKDTAMAAAATAIAVPSTGSAAAKRKAPTALTSSSIDLDCSAESLASSIGSVQLDESLHHPAKQQKSQRMTTAHATSSRLSRQTVLLHQRRHMSIDESDSSVEEASDASSVGRRKRSNTEPTDTSNDHNNGGGDGRPTRNEATTPTNSRRRLSDLSELSLSPAGISSPTTTSKKRSCNRRTTASTGSSSSSFASAPSNRQCASQSRPNGPRTRLFFTSTYKFTSQEVDAMFSIYENLESVDVIKSFGRLKTMAYVKYMTPAAAAVVLSAFLEDNEGDENGTMKLVYADAEPPATPSFPFHPPAAHRARAPSAAGESTSSEVHILTASPIVSASPSPPVSARCWLMVLYDRGVTNETISSYVTTTAGDGMKFMDIKMVRSTGESQGVAFVKFETEEWATNASRRLHDMEFPIHSKKYLQAIVIADPSLFSTPHGYTEDVTSSPATAYAHAHHAPGGPGEDGELGVVEARFAHLMSGASEQTTSGPANPVPMDDRFENHGFSAQLPPYNHHEEGPPPYGYFQFGQPYPYPAHPHPPPTHPRHQPMFYPPPPSLQQFGYDPSFPFWPDGGGGGGGGGGSGPSHHMYMPASPMQQDFSHFSWQQPANDFSSSTRPPSPRGKRAALSSSVVISSAGPLELASLMTAIQQCGGGDIVGFTKQDEREGISFVVDFADPQSAADAAKALDGTLCDGHELRATVAPWKHRAPLSHRKRQRLDQRGRRK